MRKIDYTGRQKRRSAKELKLRMESDILEQMNAAIDVPSDEDIQEQMAVNSSLRDLCFRESVEWRGGNRGIFEHGVGVAVELVPSVVVGVSRFMPRMMGSLHEMEVHLSPRPREMKKFMGLVKTRAKYLYKNTLMVATVVLDPEAYYKYSFGKDPIYAEALKKAIEKLQTHLKVRSKHLHNLTRSILVEALLTLAVHG